MEALEAKVSEFAYKIVEEILKHQGKKKKLINLIDKALGVLSSNGVYAYYVFIISQKEKEAKEIFLDSLKELFKAAKNKENYEKSNPQKYFLDVSSNLYRLLFLKQLLEKTLIYARYHAKALEDSNE